MSMLIINADDFGLCSGVNRAVVEAHAQGVLSSASLMVNMEGFDEAVRLGKLQPGLDLGIHVTLAAGRPLCSPRNVPSLVDEEGRFLRRSVLLSRILRRQIELADLEREIHAQVDKFVASGLRAAHINGDQHVHIFPGVRDIIVKVASDLGVAVRIPAEKIFWRGKDIRALPAGATKLPMKISLKFLSRSLRQICQAHQLHTNDDFISLFGFFPRRPPCGSDLIRLLDSAGDGVTELMVHPAFVDDSLVRFWGGRNDWALDREREFEALVSNQFRNALRQKGILLGGYSALLRSPAPDLDNRA